MPRLFRADYEALTRIAASFLQEAERVRQTTQSVQRMVETLRNGDWVGEGATAFYREMDSEVLPAMKRLASALEAAGRVTKDLAKLFRETEEFIARFFNALASSGLSAAGLAAALGAIGGALGSAAGAAAGAAASVAAGAAAARDAAAANRLMRGLDPKVAEIAQRSPTLVGMLAQLQRDGWTIQTRNGGGSEADRQHHVMVIDTSDAPEVQVGSLAHEGAHARYGETPFHRPTEGMTREQFIEVNLAENMRDEANSQFHEGLIRSEVMGNGGPDPGISGTQSADYQRIFNDHQAGNITREQAIDQMAAIFPNETTGTTGQTYRDYYTPTYGNWWDTHVAPARGGGR